MTLPHIIRKPLLALCHLRMRQSASKTIGQNYLRRWHIIPRNPLFNVYLHEFSGSDDDRALHDHPWWSCSIILDGWYIEHVPKHKHSYPDTTIAAFRDTGAITCRRAQAAHRIQILHTQAITLFITGPRRREWGFYCKHGWRHWRKFTDPKDPGQIGRGCD